MTGTPYLDELVRRLRLSFEDVEARRGGRGSAAIRFLELHTSHAVTLWTHEPELATAVTTLGECRDALWPGSTVEAAGFNLLLVHLDEVIATRDTTEPLRIDAAGLRWPSEPRA